MCKPENPYSNYFINETRNNDTSYIHTHAYVYIYIYKIIPKQSIYYNFSVSFFWKISKQTKTKPRKNAKITQFRFVAKKKI